MCNYKAQNSSFRGEKRNDSHFKSCSGHSWNLCLWPKPLESPVRRSLPALCPAPCRQEVAPPETRRQLALACWVLAASLPGLQRPSQGTWLLLGPGGWAHLLGQEAFLEEPLTGSLCPHWSPSSELVSEPFPGGRGWLGKKQRAESCLEARGHIIN